MSYDLLTVTFDADATRAPESPVPERRYLLVFEGSRTRVVPIPFRDEMIIGRAPDARVRIDDAAASRHHAKIVVDGPEVMLLDLDSRNGTLLNGERVTGGRELRRGDVVVIGGVSIVVHRELSAQRPTTFVDEHALRRRAEDELARSAVDPQVFAIVCVRVEADADRGPVEAALAAELRLIDAAAWGSRRELLLLVPALDEEPESIARRLLNVMGASGARAGFALHPMDGGDCDALLAGARAAASDADVSSVKGASDLATTRKIGSRTVVVVEPSMARIFELLEKLAKSTLPVLVTGETGTGKENAAAVLHHASPRASKPFVTVNCAALLEGLAESTLFGHERGAFSGAVAATAGLFEAASGGTLFLDEIGELSPMVQAKLLRVLETQKVTRVGAVAERDVDVRLVAATHRDLAAEVDAGRFRQDLLFRLGAATVMLPPLRDRPRELPVLARTLLREACARAKRAPLDLAPLAMRKVLAHGWPGNVRELKNALEYAAVTAQGTAVEPWDLPALKVRPGSIPPPGPLAGSTRSASSPPPAFRPLADEIRELEKRRIEEALVASGGVQTRAAELIGMPLRTLFGKVKLYGIVPRTR